MHPTPEHTLQLLALHYAGHRLDAAMATVERALIQQALINHKGHISPAAETLGLSRQGLYKKMKRLGIDADHFSDFHTDDAPLHIPTLHAHKGENNGPALLDHAAIITSHIESAVTFYKDIMGLHLRAIEPDPIRKGRRRAILTDEAGHAIIELIEMQEMEFPTIPGRGALHHVGFRLNKNDWHTLRDQLDQQGYGYQEMQDRIFVRDADGLTLEIEYADQKGLG